MVKRVAKKSKKGSWLIAGFMMTKEAPHTAATQTKAATAQPR